MSEIWVRDVTSGRTVKVTMTDFKALGGNFRRVSPPATRTVEQPIEQAPEKKAPVKKATAKQKDPSEGEEKAALIDALGSLGVSKKGLHLLTVEKLKEKHDEITTQEDGEGD